MRISRSRFIRRFAAVFLVGATTAMSSAMCYAINAFDSAADPVYFDGWQDGDNGGSGFTPWDFSSSLTYEGIYYGQYTDSSFHAIDNGLQAGTHYSNPFNNIGRAWAIGVSPTNNGVPRAGRGFAPLEIGQTLEVIIDNPTTTANFKGFFVRLNGGTGGVDGNTSYDTGHGGMGSTPPAMPLPKMYFSFFKYNNPTNRWGVVDSGFDFTGVTNVDSAALGALFSVKRTGDDTYDVGLDSLGAGPDYFEANRTFDNPGVPVDWIEFTFFNTLTDTGAPPTEATDFYIKSIKITTPGMPDVNMDGVVNIFDINLVSSNWGGSGPAGDANKDGIVNIFDINLISSNWGPVPGGGSAVPEPSTWIGALLGVLTLGLAKILALGKNRRRRCSQPPVAALTGRAQFSGVVFDG